MNSVLGDADGVAPDPAAARRRWLLRAGVLGMGTAGALAIATAAFANAANPTFVSAQVTPGVGTAVNVTVSGTWSWGELAGVQTSPQNDCAGRSGVGWSVDWWGVSNSPTATPITGLMGSVVNPTTSQSVAPQPATSSLTPDAAWQTKTGQYFHTSALFNGFTSDLCSHKDSQGAPIGTFSATATYPNAASVPPLICVNFYDPHGQQGKYSTSQNDNFASKDDDNSIKTNAFDPTTVTGNCLAPQVHPVSIKVDKTNNADGTGFAQTEIATTAGEAVTFKVVVKNTSTTTEVIDSPITDQYGATTLNVCDGTKTASVTADDKIVGATLAPGDSATCEFTIANYAPAAGGKDIQNTVTVSAHDVNDTKNDTGPVTSNSTVQSPAAKATLASQLLLCSSGAPIMNGNLHTTGSAGTTTIGDTQQLAATSVAPGTYTIGATAPTGYELVPCPGHTSNGAPYNGAATQSVTLMSGDKAELDFFVAPLTPNVTVAKSGPATGVLNGTGVYTIVATNGGNGASPASSFTDTLPSGETFVAQGSSTACSAAGQTVTCQLPALAASGKPGNSQSFTVVVSYSKTGVLTDCATIDGQANPSCVDTNVGAPNVTVAKSGPATGVLGDKGTYTLVATNIGNAASTATTVFDTLPAGETFVAQGSSSACSANGQIVSCTLGVLSPMGTQGDSASFTVVVSYSLPGDLKDCASAPGQATPSCVTTHIPGNPTLSVVKTNDANGDGNFTDSEVAPAVGQSVTFRVLITNTSNEAITLDSVTDAYSNVTNNECASLIGTVLAAGGSVSCDFTIAGYAPAAGTSLVDTVTVGGHDSGGTPTSAHDTSTVTTATPPTPNAPDLAIVKTASAATVKAGDALTYTLSVTNVGLGSTTGAVTVTDTVPDGLTLNSVSGGTDWSCQVTGASFTCTYLAGAIPAGGTVPVITVDTTVLSTAPTVLVNTGRVTTPGDNNPTNDTSTVKTPVTKVLGEKIPTPTSATPTLPFTGSNASQLVPIGLVALLAGFGLLVAGRRRRFVIAPA